MDHFVIVIEAHEIKYTKQTKPFSLFISIQQPFYSKYFSYNDIIFTNHRTEFLHVLHK